MACVLRFVVESNDVAKIFADSDVNFEHAELYVAKDCPKMGK